MSQNGKGSTPRPFAVDHDTYASNWDKIFGATPKKPKRKKCKDHPVGGCRCLGLRVK